MSNKTKDKSLTLDELERKQRDDAAAAAAREKADEAAKQPPPDTEAQAKAADPLKAEALQRQHDRVDKANAELNARNAEGHAKNMQRIEREAEQAQRNTKELTSGKENNRNTPRIDKYGNKTW